jgi:hypothetical protein
MFVVQNWFSREVLLLASGSQHRMSSEEAVQVAFVMNSYAVGSPWSAVLAEAGVL